MMKMLVGFLRGFGSRCKCVWAWVCVCLSEGIGVDAWVHRVPGAARGGGE